MSSPRRVLASTVTMLCLVLVLVSCSSTSTSTSKPAAEKRLPAVTLKSLDGGKPVDLRDLRGPLVVNLWASWCVPCRTELPLYADFAKKYAGRVDVLGIDFQETRVDAALQLARKSGVTYPLVADPDGSVRAIGLPKLMLVDAEGTITHEEYVEITSPAQLEDLVSKHLGVPR